MILLSVLACHGAGPCLDACREDQEFFEACYTTFVEDYQIAVTCYEDISALEEALVAAGDDEDARQAVYDQWYDEEKTYDCESAREIGAQCKARTRAEFRYLDADGRITRSEECISGESDPEELSDLMDSNDCEGFLQALGIIE